MAEPRKGPKRAQQPTWARKDVGGVPRRVVSVEQLAVHRRGRAQLGNLHLSCGHVRLSDWKGKVVARCHECNRVKTAEERWQEQTQALLRTTLAFAVPMWVQRYIDDGWTLERVMEAGRDAGQVVASAGDVIMFKSQARPARLEQGALVNGSIGTAGAFNALASGLAACSFAPEGVRFLGVVWKSNPAWLRGAA